VDNITGLRESGKAPALDALYNFGGSVHNLFNNPSSIDITERGGPRAKGNIFNQGQIEVNPFANRHNQLPVGYNDQQASPAIVNVNTQPPYNRAEIPPIKPQGPAGYTEPSQAVPTITQPATIIPPPVKVTPRVNNVSPGVGNSRRGPSYAQQARTVNRKAKSMGVASPIRRSGNKYGFGL
jgi:hypothetical protein